MSGRSRTVAVWGFVIEQWFLPLSLILQGALAMPMRGMTMFLWGLLPASMVVMAQYAWRSSDESPTGI